MVKQAAAMLAPFGSRAIVLQGSFGYLQRALTLVNGGPVAGILFDLGMNSLHVDTSIRGFSYRRDGPLDMRVDPTTLPATAANLVSKLDFPDLERIFEEWGEEPLAPVIAQAIVEWRGIGRRRRAIHSTLELRHIIEMAVDGAFTRFLCFCWWGIPLFVMHNASPAVLLRDEGSLLQCTTI